MKNIAIVGVGNCGSQIANLAHEKYDEIFDTVYINTSDSDLSMVTDKNGLKFKIGENGEVEGSGKNRTKMKEYLAADIGKILSNEDLINCISEKKYCYICSSAAGGTGSGASPILFEMMRQIFPDTNFIIITVLPQLSASLMEQGNTIEYLDELYKVLGENTTYMIYDNESVADQAPTKGLQIVNEAIVEDLRVLSGVDNFPTPYESIDEADMESIITTPGRLVVARLTKGLTEKTLEDTNLDDMIVKTIKKSCHAETNRDCRVLRWGIITFFTEAVNSLYQPTFDGVNKFIGTPVERFNHNAINPGNESLNFLYMIASGLSPINDRVKKITDRIEELKKALAKDETSRYILDGEGASYDVMAARKKADKKANQTSEINTAAIFAKFMKN